MFTPSLQHIPLLRYLLCVQEPLVDLVVVSSDPWSPDFEYSTVADPGFPTKGGANPMGDGSSYYLTKILPKNCMKMKEIGPKEGVCPSQPIGSANAVETQF